MLKEVETICNGAVGLVVPMPTFPVKNELAEDVFWNEPPETVRPLEEANPAVDMPPVKVEVAVEVAWIAATYGVVVAVTFPELSNASSADDNPTFARFKIVSALNVSVPDVNASDVSERKNERESTPSKVVASPPLEVRQLPLGIWKQPALKAMPLLKVDVAPDVNCNAPPLITIPEEVALKPGATNPEYSVEVPDWKFPTDWTERIDPGVVVPIPTFTAKLIMSPDCPKVKVFPPCPWIVEDSSKIKL